MSSHAGPTRRGRWIRLRADVVAAVLVLVALGASTQAPPVQTTLASFTDNPSLTTGSFAAHTVLPPASASCSDGLLTATVWWPSDPRYDYEVVLRRVSTGHVVSTRQVTGSGASTTYLGLLDFGLVVGIFNIDFQVEIRSKLATATTWVSSTVRTKHIHVVGLIFGVTVSRA